MRMDKQGGVFVTGSGKDIAALMGPSQRDPASVPLAHLSNARARVHMAVAIGKMFPSDAAAQKAKATEALQDGRVAIAKVREIRKQSAGQRA